MLKVRDVAEEKLYWLLGSGDIHILKDKWVANMLNDVEGETVRDLFNSDGSPNKEKIAEVCGVGVLQEIKNKGIHLDESKDRLIWILNSDGRFTLNSSWNLIRKKSSMHDWKICLASSCPYKGVNFYMEIIKKCNPY